MNLALTVLGAIIVLVVLRRVRFRNVERTVILLRAGIVAVGDVAVGVAVGFYPRLHASPGLAKFGQVLGGHWLSLAILLFVAALLICFTRTRAWGYGISSVVFLLAGIWTADVAFNSPLANGIAAVGLIMLGLILLCGVATAQIDRLPRQGPQ